MVSPRLRNTCAYLNHQGGFNGRACIKFTGSQVPYIEIPNGIRIVWFKSGRNFGLFSRGIRIATISNDWLELKNRLQTIEP